MRKSTECPLCHGNHKHGGKIVRKAKCPHCSLEIVLRCERHCPAGISHGEVHECQFCNGAMFVIVYWDGAISDPVVDQGYNKAKFNPTSRSGYQYEMLL